MLLLSIQHAQPGQIRFYWSAFEVKSGAITSPQGGFVSAPRVFGTNKGGNNRPTFSSQLWWYSLNARSLPSTLYFLSSFFGACFEHLEDECEVRKVQKEEGHWGPDLSQAYIWNLSLWKNNQQAGRATRYTWKHTSGSPTLCPPDGHVPYKRCAIHICVRAFKEHWHACLEHRRRNITLLVALLESCTLSASLNPYWF